MDKSKAFHLLDLLEKAAAETPLNGLIFYGKPSLRFVPIKITYRELLINVKINARILLAQKIAKKGRVVLIHLDNHYDYIEWYWSILATGAIPAISTPLPSDPVAAERHLRHLDKLLGHPKVLTVDKLREELAVVGELDIVTLKMIANAQVVLNNISIGAAFDHNIQCPPTPTRSENGDDDTTQFVAPVGPPQILALPNTTGDISVRPVPAAFNFEIMGVEKVDEALQDAIHKALSNPSEVKQLLAWRSSQAHIYPTKDADVELGYAKYSEEPAALMLTSGSTGNAKAVVLEHAQILAAIQGKAKALATRREDIFFNWIGFDHVACLTECHLHALLSGCNQVHIPASELIQNPLRFLELIEAEKVTVTFAPNFFVAMVSRACKKSPKDWNVSLSSLRHVVSGGEANVTALAVEVTKAVETLNGPKDGVLRTAFGMTETCAACHYNLDCPAYEQELTLPFCSLGSPIESMKQRITCDDGSVLSAGEIGNLEVSGPMVFKCYYNNPTATAESFTPDGWFKTGDKGSIDCSGVLVLSGRSKDSLILNGVKYFSHELESALDEANIPGVSPSYVAVFSVFPEESDSEELVVVFLPTASLLAASEADFVTTISNISHTSMLYCSKRPIDCFPLPIECLPKSALGKLSRPKLKIAYENGAFNEYRYETKRRLWVFADSVRVAPSTATQIKIAELFSEDFGVALKDVSISDSLADMGIDSIGIIRFKKHLEEKLGLKTPIPMIAVLRDPSIKGIAHELWKLNEDFTVLYEPVVELHSGPKKGARPPIFFIHPGLGEVLVFLNIAKYFTDRAVYAIRAPGFNPGEEMFESLDEMILTYMKAITQKQPNGPYILCGYSFGGMIAFEIAKKLEAHKYEVGFLASLNLPPHIKFRMQQLDWTETILTLASFLSFITEETAVEESVMRHQVSLKTKAFISDEPLVKEDELLDWVLASSPPHRLAELDMDKEKLRHWAHLSVGLHSLAKEYEPSGKVTTMDVFYAKPLLSVGIKNKRVWLESQLMKWDGFVEGKVRYHDCAGNHWTMLDGENCWGLQKTMKDAMAERGVL